MISRTGHNLVFVLGIPRSGTTLLCTLLDNHPDVLCPPEPWLLLGLHALGRAGTAHPADARLLSTAVSEFLTGTAAVEARRAFAVAAYERKLADAGASVLVDKTPRYYHILPEIDAMFPDSRYVWIQRDPLDVAASYLTSWGVDVAELIERDVGHPASLDIVLGLVRLERFAPREPQHLLTLRYEALVRAPDEQMAHVVEFLGLPARADLVHVGMTVPAGAMGDRKILETDSVHERSVGSGLRTLTPAQLQVLHDALGAELIERYCAPGTAEALRRRGIDDRGAAVTDELRYRAEALLEERWNELIEPPDAQPLRRLTAPIASRAEEAESSLRSLAEGHAQLRRDHEALRAEYARLAEQHDSLAQQHRRQEELVDEARQAIEHRRQWEEMTGRQRLRQSLKQIFHVMLEVAGRGGSQAPPAITVITPVGPGDVEVLATTVASLRLQSYPALEHLVTGPPDVLDQIDLRAPDGACEPAFTLVPAAPDANRIGAINAGLTAATGVVLTWLDPGDELLPGTLQRVGRTLARRRRAQAVYLDGALAIGGWRVPARSSIVNDMFAALAGETLPRGGVFIRRCPFQSIRTLDERRPLGAEDGLWLALTRWFRVVKGPGGGRIVRWRGGPAEDAARERRAVRDDFRRSLRWITTARRRPAALLRRTTGAIRSRLRPRRWHYPVDPPPGLVPHEPDGPPPARAPRCPLTRRPPDRLLMTVPGPSGREIVLLDEPHGVAWRAAAGAERAPGAAAAGPPEAAWCPYRGYGNARRLAARRGGRTDAPAGADLAADVSADRFALAIGHAATPRRALLVTRHGNPLGLAGKGVEVTAAIVGTKHETPRDDGSSVCCTGIDDVATRVSGVYDAIDVAPEVGLGADPGRTVRRLVTLLAPLGTMVLALPNLDAGLLESFGPTWSLWQHPRHPTLLTRSAAPLLTTGTDLHVERILSATDAGWVARSLEINARGLNGALDEDWSAPDDVARAARSIAVRNRPADRRGRGDWLIILLQRR